VQTYWTDITIRSQEYHKSITVLRFRGNRGEGLNFIHW